MKVLFRRTVLVTEAVEISDEILRLFVRNGQEVKPYSDDNTATDLRFTTLSYKYVSDNYTFFFSILSSVNSTNLDKPRRVAMKLSFHKEGDNNESLCNLLWFDNISGEEKVELYTGYQGERVRVLPIFMNKINLHPLNLAWWRFCSIEDWELLEYETDKPGNWVAYSPLLSGKVPLPTDSEFKISLGPDENAEILLKYLKKNLATIPDDHIREMVIDFFDDWSVGKVEQTRTDLLTMVCKNTLNFYIHGVRNKGKSDYLNHWIRVKH